MKIFILTSEFSGVNPIWMNIFWPHYNAISQSVQTVFLATPDEPDEVESDRPRLSWLDRRAHGKRLAHEVESQLDPDGVNILIVWALRKSDVVRSTLLKSVWSNFSHKVLSVVDNLNPDYVVQDIQGRFDLITCFCGDLVDEMETATGIRAIYFPPHTDTLNFHNANAYRPIDLFLVGRRTAVHAPLHIHFNETERERLSIDFVSRTRNFSSNSEDEFRQLIAAYARSKTTFCFEPSYNKRFKNRSPLTERWPHAWSSGCTVIGTTPTGKGAKDQMDWPEATIDIPTDPKEAISVVEHILADEEGLQRRRIRNVEEAIRRHDTRHRLKFLLAELNLPIASGLHSGLEKLEALSNAFAEQR